MLLDAGGITFGLAAAGDAGVGLVGVYLFVILGNGFRYGARSLFVSQLLCILAFSMLILNAPWWRENHFIGWGLMLTLIVIPNYVSVLLKRVLESRAKTEQALKECLERQRAGT
jgi:two-component system sensor histidine kinase RpfC